VKALALATTISLLVATAPASACGTYSPAEQSRIDADELNKLQELAHTASREAEEIFIGTVTELARPDRGSPELGSVSFTVEESLKGPASPARNARWKDKFVYSCQPSAMFHNVGFRPGGKFIVYVRGGEVLRSAAADHLRSGLLSLEQERVIAAGAGGS
jgi:hypothetical protein